MVIFHRYVNVYQRVTNMEPILLTNIVNDFGDSILERSASVILQSWSLVRPEKMRGHPLKNACFPDPTPMSESPVFREFHTSWIKNIVHTQRYHFGPTFSSAFVVYTCIHIMCNVVYGIFLVYIACCILVILAQHIKFPQNGPKMNRLDTKPWLHLIWVPTGRS